MNTLRIQNRPSSKSQDENKHVLISCPCYLVFKLLQGAHGEFQSIFCGAVGHPLQHHLIRLYPVADALLHH